MSITKNVGIQFVGSIVNLAALALFTPILIRTLGLQRYGFLTLVLGFTLYVGLLDFGLGPAVAYRTASFGAASRTEAPRVFATGMLVALPLAAIAGFIFSFLGLPHVSVAVGLPRTVAGELNGSFALFWVGCLTVANVVPQAGLQGLTKFKALNVISVGSSITSQLLPTIYAWLWGNNLSGILWAVAVARALTLIASLIAIACAMRLSNMGPSRREASELIKYGRGHSVATILVYISATFDRPIISAFAGAGSLPFYSVPKSVVSRLGVLSNALISGTSPSISAADEKVQLDILRKSLAALISIAPLFAICSIVLDRVLSVWIGGQIAAGARYASAVIPISLWLSSLAFTMYSFLHASAKNWIAAYGVAAYVVPTTLILIGSAWLFGLNGVVAAALFRSLVSVATFGVLTRVPRALVPAFLAQLAVLAAVAASVLWLSYPGMFLGIALLTFSIFLGLGELSKALRSLRHALGI